MSKQRCSTTYNIGSGLIYQCRLTENHKGEHSNTGMRWENVLEPYKPYGVYEDATGTLWTVEPPTKKNARREAALVGEGHRAVPVKWGRQLAAAFVEGRNYD